jgi:hypothetical protein
VVVDFTFTGGSMAIYCPKTLSRDDAVKAFADILHTINLFDTENRPEWTATHERGFYSSVRWGAHVLGFGCEIEQWERTGEINFDLANDEGGVR